MAIDYEAIARAGGLGKGPTRKALKAQRRETHREVVARVRAEVFFADRCCVVCGGPPEPTDALHELEPRSATRGRPAAQRFSRANCVRVHDGPARSCHRDLTYHRTVIETADARGADGVLHIIRAVRSGTPREATYERAKGIYMTYTAPQTKPVTPGKAKPGKAKVVTK